MKNKKKMQDKTCHWYPSVYEVWQSEIVFRETYERELQKTTAEVAIREALVAVWTAGRKYQHEKEVNNGVQSKRGICGLYAGNQFRDRLHTG